MKQVGIDVGVRSILNNKIRSPKRVEEFINLYKPDKIIIYPPHLKEEYFFKKIKKPYYIAFILDEIEEVPILEIIIKEGQPGSKNYNKLTYRMNYEKSMQKVLTQKRK